MIKNISILIIVLAMTISGYLIYLAFSPDERHNLMGATMEERFDYLSKSGNSSCSSSFRESIYLMLDEEHLQGSCCSQMSMHRYQEQVEGLEKYKNIKEIPPDPYNIEVGLAKKMMSYYDASLSSEEQLIYDYAMVNSNEKGPCCCKCWRWYVYGGLGKYLIRNHGFSGEQLTKVWNLSDGCGGEGDHGHG